LQDDVGRLFRSLRDRVDFKLILIATEAQANVAIRVVDGDRLAAAQTCGEILTNEFAVRRGWGGLIGAGTGNRRRCRGTAACGQNETAEQEKSQCVHPIDTTADCAMSAGVESGPWSPHCGLALSISAERLISIPDPG